MCLECQTGKRCLTLPSKTFERSKGLEEDLPYCAEARAAMPPSHIQLDISLVHSETLGSYSVLRSIEIGCLGMMPQVATV